MFERPDRIAEPLHVVTAVFNPVRYRSRWRLYEEFAARMAAEPRVVLHTVEVAFGERAFAVTQPGHPNHLQLRTRHELWLKENALNLAIGRLPADWKYVAWIDADVAFANPNWADDTVHALQHYAVVQPWSESVDLTPANESLHGFRSFMWCYQHPDDAGARDAGAHGGGYYAGRELQPGQPYYWHPGYAWAARREAIDALGGLLDWAILGGGDLFMARALVGQCAPDNLPRSLGRSGVRWLLEWQARAERHIRRNVGFVEGLLMHYWHGPKVKRKYRDRGAILTSARFDPERDLKRDWQGLWQLTERSHGLRDGIRGYFRQRDEDSTS